MTASKRSMCRVRLSVPGVTRYGPVNQNFVCSFVSSLLHIDIGQFRRGNEDSRGNESLKLWKKNIFCWKK